MEEWNEYGELKENIGSGAPVTSNSSTSTPSKPPQSKSTPTIQTPSKINSQPSQPSEESPLTAAMRQVGLEAAKKASDTKSKATSTKVGQSKASTDMLEKPEDASSVGASTIGGTIEPSSGVAPKRTATTDSFSADDALITSRLSKDTTPKSDKQKVESEDVDTGGGTSTSTEIKEPEYNPTATGKPDVKKDLVGDGANVEYEDDGEDEVSKKPEGQESISVAQGASSKKQGEDLVLAAIKRGKTGGPLLDHRKLDTQDKKEKEKEIDEQPTGRTQDQPAAEGHEANESVGD